MSPRTIDNIGIDVSTRYAEDKQRMDEKIIQDAQSISTQTEIDVTSPSYPLEFDILFETNRRNIFWAYFQAPLAYGEQKKRLFTYQIIPSLGSDDKKEALVEKIRARLTAKKEKEDDKKLRWQQEKEEEEESKEKNILLELISKLSTLEKYLVEINARRSQYQKG